MDVITTTAPADLTASYLNFSSMDWLHCANVHVHDGGFLLAVHEHNRPHATAGRRGHARKEEIIKECFIKLVLFLFFIF